MSAVIVVYSVLNFVVAVADPAAAFPRRRAAPAASFAVNASAVYWAGRAADPVHGRQQADRSGTDHEDRARARPARPTDILHLPRPLARLSVPRASSADAVPVAPLTADVPIGVGTLSYAGTSPSPINVDATITDLDILSRGIQRGLNDLEGPARR